MFENRGRLLYKITLIVCSVFIPYYLIWLYEGWTELFWIDLLTFLPVVVCWFLLSKRMHAAAAFSIIMLPLLNVYIYDEGIGGSSAFYFYLFPIFMATFYFFKKDEVIYRNISIILILLTLVLTNIPGASPQLYTRFPELAIKNIHLPEINFFLALGATMISVVLVNRAYNNTERKLKDALKRAEEVAELKSQFLSNMSHEIRTPMNAIIGMTNLLISEKPAPEQVEKLTALQFSASNLMHIINDILDYSRIEAGNIEFENRSFNLRELLNNNYQSQLRSAQLKNLNFHLEIDDNVPQMVRGDANRLDQVLNNLINNAIKFTSSGSIKVKASQIKQDGDFCSIRFSIIDTGIGIPAEKLPVIFDLFTQASSETTRKYGGTGLGLAICSKLLALKGSHLQVESIPGHGSCFSFDLSFRVEESLAAPAKVTGEQLGKVRILLAEDNAINQLVARNFIEKWGAELEIAGNGKEAVEILKARDFDLVLMDLQMPEMDGYEATRSIRAMADDKYRRLPIIALTASSLHEVQEQYIASGMNDFVRKPFNPDELYSMISRYMYAA